MGKKDVTLKQGGKKRGRKHCKTGTYYGGKYTTVWGRGTGAGSKLLGEQGFLYPKKKGRSRGTKRKKTKEA